MDEAGKFLKSNIDWVRERLGRVPEPVPFADGAQIPLRGQLHRVCFTGARRGRAVVEIEHPGRACPASTLRPVEHAAAPAEGLACPAGAHRSR